MSVVLHVGASLTHKLPTRLAALVGVALIAFCMFAGAAKADTYVFDFMNYGASSTGKDLGNAIKTFNAAKNGGPYAAGYSLTAHGGDFKKYSPAPPPLNLTGETDRDLSVRNATGGETGLGLYGTAQNEIGVRNVVELDFTAILSLIGNTSIAFSIESVQPGEGYQLFGSSNFNNPLIAQDGTLGVQQTFTISSSEVALDHGKFYVTANSMITAPNGSNNVLIQSATLTTPGTSNGAPLPSTASTGIALLGALSGLKLLRRRGSVA